MYNAYVGYGLADSLVPERFFCIPAETCRAFWRRSLEYYLEAEDTEVLAAVETKAKIIGLSRVMRREIRRGGLNREDGRRLIEACRLQLTELLPRAESLVF